MPHTYTYPMAELHRLRESASDTMMALVARAATEEALKEHVLKPSASFGSCPNAKDEMAPSIPAKKSNTLLVPSGSEMDLMPILIDHRKASLYKTSPTPSIKKGKAEKLLKDHGSPPGIRVTAGGRIVTTGQNQHFIGTTSTRGPYRGAEFPYEMPMPHPHSHGNFRYPHRAAQHQLSVSAQIQALEKHHRKMEEDLKDLDRKMIIHRDKMVDWQRNYMIEQRKSMVVALDDVRVSLKQLRQIEQQPDQPRSPYQRPRTMNNGNMSHFGIGAFGATALGPPHVQTCSEGNLFPLNPYSQWSGYQQGHSASFQPLPLLPYGIPYAPIMYQPVAAPLVASTVEASNTRSASPRPSLHSVTNARAKVHPESTDSEGDSKQNQHNEGSAQVQRGRRNNEQRRSHAVEIKDPSHSTISEEKKTKLNPASPSYQPVATHSGRSTSHIQSSSTIDSALRTPARNDDRARISESVSSTQEEGISGLEISTLQIGPNASCSSIATADFFPKNCRDHSSGTYARCPNTPEDTYTTFPRQSIPPASALEKLREVSPSQLANKAALDEDADSSDDSFDDAKSSLDGHGGSTVNDPVHDRKQINVSPKTRRHLEHEIDGDHASPNVDDKSRSPSGSPGPELKAAPMPIGVDFLMGMASGMSRQPIEGTPNAEWLKGYAQGLLTTTGNSRPQPPFPNRAGKCPVHVFNDDEPPSHSEMNAAHEPTKFVPDLSALAANSIQTDRMSNKSKQGANEQWRSTEHETSELSGESQRAGRRNDSLQQTTHDGSFSQTNEQCPKLREISANKIVSFDQDRASAGMLPKLPPHAERDESLSTHRRQYSPQSIPTSSPSKQQNRDPWASYPPSTKQTHETRRPRVVQFDGTSEKAIETAALPERRTSRFAEHDDGNFDSHECRPSQYMAWQFGSKVNPSQGRAEEVAQGKRTPSPSKSAMTRLATSCSGSPKHDKSPGLEKSSREPAIDEQNSSNAENWSPSKKKTRRDDWRKKFSWLKQKDDDESQHATDDNPRPIDLRSA